MNILDSTKKSKQEEHSCSALKTDEYIIFYCDQCDYQLRKNLVSGEIEVQNLKAGIRHTGMNSKTGFSGQNSTLN